MKGFRQNERNKGYVDFHGIKYSTNKRCIRCSLLRVSTDDGVTESPFEDLCVFFLFTLNTNNNIVSHDPTLYSSTIIIKKEL